MATTGGDTCSVAVSGEDAAPGAVDWVWASGEEEPRGGGVALASGAALAPLLQLDRSEPSASSAAVSRSGCAMHRAVRAGT